MNNITEQIQLHRLVDGMAIGDTMWVTLLNRAPSESHIRCEIGKAYHARKMSMGRAMGIIDDAGNPRILMLDPHTWVPAGELFL